MHSLKNITLIAASLFIGLATTACTGGEVLYDGARQAGATVTYRNCAGTTWTKTTNSSGYYTFNPYDPNSSAFHNADYIPEGVYLATASYGAWKVSNMVSHSFDRTCDITWNGSQQELPCTRRDFDLGFRPLSGWEYNTKLQHQKEHNDLQNYQFNIEYCIHFGGGN